MRVMNPEELEDYKWSSFIHAEAHDQAGTDYELCEDDECPHWPEPTWTRAGED